APLSSCTSAHLEIDLVRGIAEWFAVGWGRNPTLAELRIEREIKLTRAPGDRRCEAGWCEDAETLELGIRAGATLNVAVGLTPYFGGRPRSLRAERTPHGSATT